MQGDIARVHLLPNLCIGVGNGAGTSHRGKSAEALFMRFGQWPVPKDELRASLVRVENDPL